MLANGDLLASFEANVVRLFRPVAIAFDFSRHADRQANGNDDQRRILELGIGPFEIECNLCFAAGLQQINGLVFLYHV